MKTSPVTLDDLRGVFVVPPLARRRDEARGIDLEQNDVLVRHMLAGGSTRLLYGGNAFLYHVTREEFETLIGWLAAVPGDVWAIPSIGPSFGRALDQARSVVGSPLPHDDAAALQRPARRSGPGAWRARDRRGCGRAAHPLPEGGRQLRQKPGSRPGRGGPARQRRHSRRHQVRRRAAGPGGRSVSRTAARARRSPPCHQRHG